jgi:predicted short-subunit dehydrogenase-like oxidoreductase (DUF2520 family)
MGRVMAAGLRQTGLDVTGPLPRGAVPANADVVLLCVPDGAIATAAAAVPRGPLVGHCSGATGLEVLSPHDGFSLHPLMTVTAQDGPERLQGAAAAIDATTPAALLMARQLGGRLGLRPLVLRAEDRVAYHAAAAMASNFLVTLEAAAEQLAAGTGIERADLAALVRATVDNWARLGAREALTGPVARGDAGTVTRHRMVVAERAPELLELFDALVGATQRLAAAGETRVAA